MKQENCSGPRPVLARKVEFSIQLFDLRVTVCFLQSHQQNGSSDSLPGLWGTIEIALKIGGLSCWDLVVPNVVLYTILVLGHLKCPANMWQEWKSLYFQHRGHVFFRVYPYWYWSCTSFFSRVKLEIPILTQQIVCRSFSPCGAGGGTQDLAHVKQVLCHWTTAPVLAAIF